MAHLAGTDLFGNPDRMESGSAPAIAVDLFTATAERLAYESGRALSQERADLFATIDVVTDRSRTSDVRPLFYDTAEEAYAASVRTGRAVVRARELQTCKACGASFHAHPRADSTCNLCRRKAPC